jgi:hypothetical protein
MDADDKLRLDYEQTTQLMRTLLDIRFKLLAFVPTIAGASVGLVGRGGSAAVLLAVGLLGLSATLGILLYELRNAQIFDSVVARAAMLEEKLGLGLFRDRPRPGVTLFGLVAARHERGLGLVYGAALAGWSYLVVWGALRALDVGGARKIGAVAGVLAWLVVVAEVERLGRRRDDREPEARSGHTPTPSPG